MNMEEEVGLAHLKYLQDRLTYGVRALVVDDNRDDLAQISHVLKDLQGFQIFEELDGQSAVNRIRTDKFDIIFLDLKLIPMSGIEVLQQIKGRSRVVIITGLESDAPEVIAALRLGARKFVTKPLTKQKLNGLVH